MHHQTVLPSPDQDAQVPGRWPVSPAGRRLPGLNFAAPWQTWQTWYCSAGAAAASRCRRSPSRAPREPLSPSLQCAVLHPSKAQGRSFTRAWVHSRAMLSSAQGRMAGGRPS